MTQHCATFACAERHKTYQPSTHQPSTHRPTGTTWPGIQGDVLSRLAAVGHVVDCPADQIVWEDGAPVRFGGVLLSGMVRIQRYGDDGRRQIMCMLLPGDFITENGFQRSGFSMATASRVEILRVDRRVFSRMLQDDRDLRGLSYIQNLSRLERLRWMTWATARLSASDRYLAFLAMATKVMPYHPMPDGSGVLTMILSRSDIADLLATTPETICRLNKKLERDGVLEMRGPAHMRLIRPAEILKMGDVEAESGTAILRTGLEQGDLAQLRSLSTRHDKTLECASVN